MRRRVIDTRATSKRVGKSQRWVEAEYLKLECGHHKVVTHSHRRTYEYANCLVCNKEKADGRRYAWSSEADDYVPTKEMIYAN